MFARMDDTQEIPRRSLSHPVPNWRTSPEYERMQAAYDAVADNPRWKPDPLSLEMRQAVELFMRRWG